MHGAMERRGETRTHYDKLRIYLDQIFKITCILRQMRRVQVKFIIEHDSYTIRSKQKFVNTKQKNYWKADKIRIKNKTILHLWSYVSYFVN